ncbi:MAG: 2-amino-4-hydroxy-6-hydroxymethyldihydropteridine diphosphokinase [Gammaproteobacteria bacterium]|nr:2-amino-4-hydroxy-6-hydroxymethyldihydropteridine diphosphokinase [Gammaproteobacteria bacterium]MBV8495731.1 2-amino-4-hydroxy-6-hydroxymethyldihydropteridine diphosphokinase [Gammaproteobacteria bacterium]
MPEVYVAAGSSVAPERALACAVAELQREFPGTRYSSWYRNAPADAVGPPYINLVAGFGTVLAPREVQARLRSIERRCGRVRSPAAAGARAPPPLDLDLLMYGDLVCVEPGLTLPRPELLTRAYILGPLAELAPQVMHPTARRSIGELWRGFDQAAHPLERLQ